jgi:hypothetical protein
MKIISLNQELTKISQNSDVGQKQQAAMNSAISILKGKIPEIVPMLSNPKSREFLMKFFDMVASDPSILNSFKNSLQVINSAMQADSAGTTAVINSSGGY